jgi:anti-sigma factor RsiW
MEAVLAPYITCQQLIDFIGAYRDNELPAAERAEFERHLGVCPSCVAYLSTYEKTVLLARRSRSDEVPPDVPEALIEAILAARNKA